MTRRRTQLNTNTIIKISFSTHNIQPYVPSNSRLIFFSRKCFFNVSALSRSLNDRKFYCSITFLHMARSLGFSSFGSPDLFKENSKNVRHNRRPVKNAFSCKVKVMMDGGNRRRSVSQVVIGFSDEHRTAIRDQNELFYGDIISDDDSEGCASSKPP